MAASVAAGLVDEQPAERIRDALEALAGKRLHNPAGWLVRAIAGAWDLSADVDEARRAGALAQARAHEEAAALDRRRQKRDRDACSVAWSSALSAALDDAELAEVIGRLTRPVPGIGRRSVPTVCADLVRWAQAVVAPHPGRPLDVALRAALAAQPTPNDVPDDPADVAPPAPSAAVPDLSVRVAALLNRDRHRTPSPSHELSL